MRIKSLSKEIRKNKVKTRFLNGGSICIANKEIANNCRKMQMMSPEQ